MSSDPQWKTFQPSTMDSDTAILDCKSLSSVMPSHGSSNGTSYNSGNHYSYPLHHHKDMSNNMYSNRAHEGQHYSYNMQPNTWGGGGSSGGSGNGGGGGANNPSNNSGSGGSSASSFSIGTFTGREGTEAFNGDSSPSTNNSYNHGHSNNTDGSFQRETGIIEKLLHSYGFIQCCERQARLFFHFSQFNGNIEHLKIGDPVEFEMTYDRRTGKPIASFVTKIAPEVVLSEERVTGNVTTEIRSDASGSETQGRISYENRGECFFLPYNKDDVEGNVTLRSGDTVSFQIAANSRGNLGASHVRLENAAHPVKYQGVVCTMKESFGFIERADIVKEIFFHFSESKEKRDLQLGDDVEFTIQTRNGKEVACGITLLDPGSVIFEDVCDEILKGQVLKPLERGQQARHQNDPLPGRIKYRAADHSEVEVPFGDKDQKGDFTLRHGDWVQFHLATDRRDGLKRATQISLLDDSFTVSLERREQGMVSCIRDSFGFLRCAERETDLFFRFHEILDVDRVPVVGDEVEFTMDTSSSSSSSSQNRQSAIRIKYLPPNTVQFETIVKEKNTGKVTDVPASSWSQRSPVKTQVNGKTECGQITYTSGEGVKVINFPIKDCDPKNMPACGDKVEFDIAQVKCSKKFVAVNVRVKRRSTDNEVQQHNGSSKVLRDAPIQQGFIAALKDGFGFIENISHDKEVFFHFSTLEGEAVKLALGMEVEYNLGVRTNSGSCMSAENVRILPPQTLKQAKVLPDVLTGKVVRPLRSVNPDQDQYAGIVEVNTETEEEKGQQYEFGITSLANKKELLQAGDPVTFQVDEEGRAANIAAIRKKRRAIVDLVKGQFGFLSYEVKEGTKLFFHTSEVTDGTSLQAGDVVEFEVVTNHRHGKSSACNITKVSENIQRPERLISRLRTISVDDSGPKLTVTRQPKGPDSTKGFSAAYRQPRQPGVLLE